jgi:hypothetical protein
LGNISSKGRLRNLLKKQTPPNLAERLLLGVNGVALIAHGGSDVKAVKNSVRTAAAFVEKGINRQISEQIHQVPAASARAGGGARLMKGVRFLATGVGCPPGSHQRGSVTKSWTPPTNGLPSGPALKNGGSPPRGSHLGPVHPGRPAGFGTGESSPDQLDAIIVATCTPDHLFPSTACLVQKNLRVPACIAFDVSAACSGFIYGLAVANGLIATGSPKPFC